MKGLKRGGGVESYFGSYRNYVYGLTDFEKTWYCIFSIILFLDDAKNIHRKFTNILTETSKVV